MRSGRALAGCLLAAGCVACGASPAGGGDLPADAAGSGPAGWAAGDWTFAVDRVWDPAGASVTFPTDALDEADYRPATGGKTYPVVLSADGKTVAIGKPPFVGTRTFASADRVLYDLGEGTFAGGRFAVWPDGGGLQAELTIYGSGLPIARSERGALAR